MLHSVQHDTPVKNKGYLFPKRESLFVAAMSRNIMARRRITYVYKNRL
jgi:hypothetical protein